MAWKYERYTPPHGVTIVQSNGLSEEPPAWLELLAEEPAYSKIVSGKPQGEPVETFVPNRPEFNPDDE